MITAYLFCASVVAAAVLAAYVTAPAVRSSMTTLIATPDPDQRPAFYPLSGAPSVADDWGLEHNDVNPVCGCHRASNCLGCGVCTSCDGCYCGED